jgi:hypothetical protein
MNRESVGADRRQALLETVAKNGAALKWGTEENRSDKVIVCVAVRQCGMALQYASRELKDDFDVVAFAVSKDGYSLYHASKALQNNCALVKMAVRQNGFALEFSSDACRADREVCSAAVAQNGNALHFASRNLKEDESLVAQAVRQNVQALQYAAKGLQTGGLLGVMAHLERLVCAHEGFVAVLLAAADAATTRTTTRGSGGVPASARRQQQQQEQEVARLRHCPLRLLGKLGDDDSGGGYVKRLIAEFAGVPCGADWVSLRRSTDDLAATLARFQGKCLSSNFFSWDIGKAAAAVTCKAYEKWLLCVPQVQPETRHSQ